MSPDAAPPDELLAALQAALRPQYSVERILGQGGMGSVFLGRDVTLDRPVAIKVINADVASSATIRDRFLQEARNVARLRHPNIVSVYSAGDTNGLLHFEMEFVSGESLRELLAREKRLEPERAERILSEIALALGHAHELGLVHRDVKPENILIETASGRALLTDFGVSRAFEKEGGLTMTGMILGSPRYMSPEQASGDKAVDGRSDLYSLALVGYEMFTGAPVVDSATISGMLVKHLTETPAPLGTKVSGVPEHVAAAIDRALAKDPAERWQTGREFSDALGGSANDRAEGPKGQRAKGSKRTAFLVTAVAAFAATIAVAVRRGGGGGAAGNAYLVAPFEIQTGDQSVAWLHEGSVNMLTLTLGQWTDLHVVDYERTLSLLDKAGLGSKPRLSLDDAMKVARLANAGTVVTGQVQSIGQSMVVTAKRYSVRSGKSESQAQDSAALGADPRPLFDRLAQKLLNLEGNRTSMVQLASATTTNLEAYRAYLNGVKLLNTWRLYEADTAFDHAISLDSTFALAYHKKSLGLGWGDVSRQNNPAYKAFELSSRLPERERTLVAGHYHLVRALYGFINSDTTQQRIEYAASISAYDSLLARGDTLVPEAWFGRADAYHHRRQQNSTNQELKDWTTQSFRGFSKTLQIDSTFHLAYAHLIELLNNAATRSGLLISGDSALILDDATIARLKPEGIQKLRDDARKRGIETARAWARADDGSTRPFLQLANSYMAAAKYDSAVITMHEALAKPRSGAAGARLALVTIQLATADTGLAATVQGILDKYNADTLHTIAANQRFGSEGELLGAAAAIGSSAALDKAAKLFWATDTIVPSTSISTRFVIDLYTLSSRVAMGEPVTPALHQQMLSTMRGIDGVAGNVGAQVRAGSASVPYLMYLATRDTAFIPFIKKWYTSKDWSDIDAMVALSKHDTATALRIAQTYTKPDSLAKAQFALGGMRTMARAEVLASLGLTRQAAETYEATGPERFLKYGLAEPGYTVWVRSFLARARLWKEAGEREKAVKAYEQFLTRWKSADGVAAKQVSEARQELAQLKDARK
ncbi:MAG TPA: serine/threonine-protein kinase [Gemmatimonadaceae bacterium]|nr:serine/threonine-protein kinase [Gemmatimonadaceae bacterium]